LETGFSSYPGFPARTLINECTCRMSKAYIRDVLRRCSEDRKCR
jgi:hypothetical protein